MGRWEDDLSLMHAGVEALFNNEFEKSEELLKKGMDQEPPSSGDDRDVRGSFAMVYALVAVMRGVATFADDQLKECEDRLKVADRMAQQDSNWPGKKVTRGISGMSIGVLQLMRHAYVQGIVTIFKSWGYVKSLRTEAMDYAGKEREVVRSAALYTLASFYLLIGLLPDQMKDMVSWATGMPGSREEGLAKMRICFEEGGLLQNWAALTLIAYHVDTKTFLGEKLTAKELALTKSVVDWAKEKYPQSVFFSGLIADFVAVTERNVPLARSIQEAHAAEMDKMPALKWAQNYKRGIYGLCDCLWYEAGVHFQNSIDVYVEVGRRSMVPFMCSYAFLCYKQHLAESEEEDQSKSANDALERATAMMELLKKYEAMPKKDWGRQDTWAFATLADYVELGQEDKKKKRGIRKKKRRSKASQWPLLQLAEIMTLYVRCVWWMSEAQLTELLKKIDAEVAKSECSVDEHIRIAMCKIEIYQHLRNPKKSLNTYHQMMDKYADNATKSEKAFGAIPYSHFLIAKMYEQQGDLGSAKTYLDRLKKCGSKFELYQLLMLKAVVLNRAVSEELDDHFQSLDVPAGQTNSVMVTIAEDSPPIIRWFWLVKKHNVNFVATFIPDKEDASPITLQAFDRKEATDEATSGEFNITEERGYGKLLLTWDNGFSMLRGKTVMFRFVPKEVTFEITHTTL